MGRKLIDLPGYVFRVFVTNRRDSALEIWRDYNGRAIVECRIDDLENELAADHFCLRSFFATESAFLAVLFGFNLLGEFQRALDPALKTYKQPATLRFEVFTCGAILGRSGHHLVLHMSKNWRVTPVENRSSIASYIGLRQLLLIRSLHKKCRMKSIDLAAQLRNLGLSSVGAAPLALCSDQAV